MKLTQTLVLLTALGSVPALAGAASAAPIEALGFSVSATASYSGPVVAGFLFQVLNTIQVTDLGAFDLGGDGFLNSHAVGIWDNNPTLLTSTTVTTSDPLSGDFRYASITPLTLNPGYYYVGAADYNGGGQDSMVFVNPADLSVAPDISYYQGAVSQTHSGLVWPGLYFQPDITPFGANFRYTTVPEPGDAALLGMALLGWLVAGWRVRGSGRHVATPSK